MTPTHLAADGEVRRSAWFEEQRLRFIEARLFWSGRINRSDLIDQFGIHRAVASQDLTRYQEAAPGNAVYDKSAKTYIAKGEFRPVYDPPSPLRLLGHALLEDQVPASAAIFAVVPTLARAAAPVVLRNALVAAREQLAIRIHYRSMRDPEGTWRWIEPRQIIYDGARWHVRAFCRAAGGFRDFLISRIDRLGSSEPAQNAELEDVEWFGVIRLEITPHPSLTQQQQRLVSHDYCMRAGQLMVTVRKALAWYVIVNLGLDQDLAPPRQVLCLVNPDVRALVHPRNYL